MKNMILPAKLHSYSGEYATVSLPQIDTSEIIEEVIVCTSNISSQNLPHVGSDVLLVIDNFGDAYILSSFSSENQTRPENSVKDIVLNTGKIKMRLTETGKISIGNGTEETYQELIRLVENLIDAVVLTPDGAAFFSAATKAKLYANKENLEKLAV